MNTTTFDALLSSIEQLTPEQQETLIEIIRKRLFEARRHEIATSAKETMKAYRAGKAKRGTIHDLRKTFAK